jgi:protein-tyrosine phosphatase/membrane-associated phospholipid phosphatase
MGDVHRLHRATQRRMRNSVPRSKAIAVSAGLSTLFIVVYGGCNWITAHRGHVGAFYFDWERKVPFVPLLIPAYMSLDLFFISAPFLLPDGEQLRAYTKRITAAIVIAGLCFLVFPLRFAFARPESDGVLGVVFHWFRNIDAPYNLFPSLHAALLLLVADVYARELRGWAWNISMFWFFLISISPILTYQHHLVDILGGFVLAGYCSYLFPNRANNFTVERNNRVGGFYAAGAAILGGAALIFQGWGMLLLWPAVALGIAAGAYFGVGPGIYRKRSGRLTWSTRMVLGPCLIGQYLSLLYYRRQCRPWSVVTSHVWIGGKLTHSQTNEALHSGVRTVLDLTAEFSECAPFRALAYRNIPVLDLTAPTQAQLSEMAEFIRDHIPRGIVYVHCKIGYSRSAAAVAAYLVTSGNAVSAADAFAMIRRVRPTIVIRPEIVAALDRFQLEQQPTVVCDQSFLLASAGQALA